VIRRVPSSARSPNDDCSIVAVADNDLVELLDGLTACEEELVTAAGRGRPLQCGQLPRQTLAATTDPRYVIRADLIRELLLGWRGALDPRGIRLTGARITGLLDLDFLRVDVGLVLARCVFGQPVQLRNAQFPSLSLSGSSTVEVWANRLRVEGDLLLNNGFQAVGGGPDGTVRLADAHLGALGCAWTEPRSWTRASPPLGRQSEARYACLARTWNRSTSAERP